MPPGKPKTMLVFIKFCQMSNRKKEKTLRCHLSRFFATKTTTIIPLRNNYAQLHISVLTFGRMGGASHLLTWPTPWPQWMSEGSYMTWSEPIRVFPWDISNYNQGQKRKKKKNFHRETRRGGWEHENETPDARSTQPVLCLDTWANKHLFV